jgi:hypothetical protein
MPLIFLPTGGWCSAGGGADWFGSCPHEVGVSLEAGFSVTCSHPVSAEGLPHLLDLCALRCVLLYDRGGGMEC